MEARFVWPEWHRALHVPSHLVLSLLLVLGCSALPARALDMVVWQHQGKRVLLLEGKFEKDDGRRFETLLSKTKAMPVEEIWFNSGGGSTVSGYAIGRAIRRSGLSVRLPAKSLCASACADAFMGGVARRVEEGARFGIHMGTVANDPDLLRQVVAIIQKAAGDEGGGQKAAKSILQQVEQWAAQEAASWAAYIIEMGGSLRLVALGTKTEAGGMNYLGRRQLIDLNVVNVDD